MSFWEQIPCTSIVYIILGIISFSGGVRILRQRTVTLTDRDFSRQQWKKPVKISGKESRFWGILYAVLGLLLIIFAILTFIGGV